MGSGCASWPRRWSDRPCCIDTKPIVVRAPIWWHLFDVTVLEPFEQSLHLVRRGRKLMGVPIRSINLDDGRLVSSAFVTDRDPATLTPDNVRWGPTKPGDRATPPFVITKSKTEGKTAGFFVTDARGARYLFKLDPIEVPELLSGAEVVSSKLLFALGYHVPSYEIVFVRPGELGMSEGAVMKDRRGEAHPFTEEMLRELLEPRVRDGTMRVAASKILDGEILGPASFKRFRDCTEMRALRVAYAWLNNIDAKDHNTLLIWDGQRTTGYLIDFGTSLGADAGLGAPKMPCEGWRYVVDMAEASLELLTLGLHRPACDPQMQTVNPRVGLLSTHVDPTRWKPYAPNLAFQEMDEEDAEWIVRRLARFSREQIAAAVSAGQYSRPEDAAYLTEVLDQRRLAIIGRYADEEGDDDR